MSVSKLKFQKTAESNVTKQFPIAILHEKFEAHKTTEIPYIDFRQFQSLHANNIAEVELKNKLNNAGFGIIKSGMLPMGIVAKPLKFDEQIRVTPQKIIEDVCTMYTGAYGPGIDIIMRLKDIKEIQEKFKIKLVGEK